MDEILGVSEATTGRVNGTADGSGNEPAVSLPVDDVDEVEQV